MTKSLIPNWMGGYASFSVPITEQSKAGPGDGVGEKALSDSFWVL